MRQVPCCHVPSLACPVSTCQDGGVGATVRTPLNVEALVEHMFDQVLTESERAELLVWIRRWEAAHPDADPSHRVTGWIDVAYAFQTRTEPRLAPERSAHESGWDLRRWALA